MSRLLGALASQRVQRADSEWMRALQKHSHTTTGDKVGAQDACLPACLGRDQWQSGHQSHLSRSTTKGENCGPGLMAPTILGWKSQNLTLP